MYKKMTQLFVLLILILALGLMACSNQTESESASIEVEELAAVVEVEEPTTVVEVEELAVVVEADEPAIAVETEEPAAIIEAENATNPVSTGNTTFIVETAVSTIGWLGDKIVGDSHSGSIDVLEGALIVEEGSLVSGTIVIDMGSIVGDSDRLVTHLKSDDFFNVNTYPTATIELISAESLGDDAYAVTGDLTIKGISNPIEFMVQAVEEGNTITASSDIVFDRTLYDVVYKSGSFFSGLGDGAINDEVQISVALVAVK